MERAAGYHVEFCSLEEMQDDVHDAVSNALDASGKKFYIIKAMTGAGKSHSYIEKAAGDFLCTVRHEPVLFSQILIAGNNI